jgi:glycosyltransferase involved in cell wall biosynthesis
MTRTKKVGMIAYAQYGPDARIKAYVRSIEQAGGSVDIFALQEATKEGYKQVENTRVFYLSKKYQGTSSLLYVFSYLVFFIKALLRVSYHAIKERYVAVHVHNMPNFIIYAAIIAKLMGAKLLLDVHDLMTVNYMVKFNVTEESILTKLLIMEQRASAWLATRILCADHKQKSYLERVCNIPSDKVTVIMNLPHEDTFQVTKRQKPDGKFKLVYHGTIAQRLGIDILIKAISLIGDEAPIHLSIYGSGDFLPEALRLADTLGLNGKIHFSKAFFPAEKIADMVGGMDLGVVGNRRSLATAKFMMPVKILEYVYLKIPVVAPRLEVIQSYFDEQMLKYYEPENTEDLARCIVQLFKCPEERERLVNNASNFYAKRSWKTQAEEYLKLLS